jgi:hypothetical protein
MRWIGGGIDFSLAQVPSSLRLIGFEASQAQLPCQFETPAFVNA